MRTLALALLLAGCTGEPPVDESQSALDVRFDAAPTGRGTAPRSQHLAALANKAKRGSNGISYHGGPVMLNTPNIYFIWYGAWGSNSAKTILTNFISSLGGSSYEHINSTYYNSSNTHVTGQLHYAGAYSESAYLGTSLSDAQILQVATDAVNGGHLPKDANGLYMVLTSAEVNATSGFCTQYCGWHDYNSASNIRYAFIGNPDRCPADCEDQTTSPNGNAGADGMASIIAHESEEAISDPQLNAWYDNQGEENADKCAWTFGTESTASNGSSYNITLGGHQYLIQQNWVNASGGYCAMSY